MNLFKTPLITCSFLLALFVQCISNEITVDLEDIVILPDPVNIEGYWIQVKTEFTNPDGTKYQDDYKVGHYWKMTNDSIFELDYPNHVSYASSYTVAFEYGIRCSTTGYNTILNAYYRGDTLILGGNNETNIEHEYFLINADLDQDSIDDLVSKRVNWKAYYGKWEFVMAYTEGDEMLDELNKDAMNFKIPDFILMNEKTNFNFDTLEYYDESLKQLFSFRFTDPFNIHNTVPQLVFEYIPDPENGAIILQYQVADSTNHVR